MALEDNLFIAKFELELIRFSLGKNKTIVNVFFFFVSKKEKENFTIIFKSACNIFQRLNVSYLLINISGAVALDGRIEPGDMILQVNDINFENMSNDEAVRVLREVVQKPG